MNVALTMTLGLVVGAGCGAALVLLFVVSLGGSEAMAIIKARLGKDKRLFKITEPNGRMHLIAVKRDDKNPFYQPKKYDAVIPNPNTAEKIQPLRGDKGLEIWETVTHTPLLIDVPQKLFIQKALETCREAHPELAEMKDDTLLSLLHTRPGELMHDCVAICGPSHRPIESCIESCLAILDRRDPEDWDIVITQLDREMKRRFDNNVS